MEDTLPERWVLTTLSDVFTINPGVDTSALPDSTMVSFIPMTAVEAETGHIDTSRERRLDEVRRGYTAFQEGDVLFAKITPCMENGKFAVVRSLSSGIGFGSTEFHVLRQEKDVDAQLLFYYLVQTSLRQAARANMTGSAGQLRVPVTFLADTLYPLPPANEQRRIVAAIEQQFSRLDEAVTSLQHARKKLKRERAAILKAAVEGTLTAEWRAQHPAAETAEQLLARILKERRAKWEADQLAKMQARGLTPKDDSWKKGYKEPEPPDTGDLSELPEGWVWATVEQLAAAEPNAITDGPFGSNLKTEHYKAEGMRVIRLQNIGDGVFNDEKAFIAPDHFEKLRKHQVFAGDLVIAALGDNPPRSCITPEFVGPAIVKADCIRYKVSPYILNAYTNIALNTEPTRRRTSSLIHGIGRPRLNLSEIKSIVIPLPPLLEQESIVEEAEERLSIIARTEVEVEANLKRAERLRQTILTEAFAGRLAPQDPDDEPASVLLERIKEERMKREQEELQRRKEASMNKAQDGKKRKAALKVRLPLHQVLSEMRRPITPDDLFQRAGLQSDTIEEFYEELRREVVRGRIREMRPDETKVYLEAVLE